MDAEVGGDLLQRHAGIAIPGDAHDVVSVLAGVGLGHSDILPGLPGSKPARLSPISAADPTAVLQMRAAKRRGAFDYRDGFVWHRGGWSRPGYDRRRFGVVEVHAATEQTPHRENRIQLTDRRDRLGRRGVGVRLHWSREDYDNIGRSIELFSREIEASGVGCFERWVRYSGPQQPMTTGLHHPMGGTRMSEDPRTGVVDADCRVHGKQNVFIAGSSVFSTGLGYSNPTLTIMALALRLADHIGAGGGVHSAEQPDAMRR